MTEILLASRNKGKVKELQDLLLPLNIKVLCLNDFPLLPEVEEDGDSFTANAIKKACETSQRTGYICLADDSGLEVDALDGQPGIYSARFAGENASDEDNNNKLLSLLANVQDNERNARFVCVIAVCDPDGICVTVEGTCAGKIGYFPQGNDGFGYDPLFIPDGFEVTFAQISSEEKHKISHRGQAIKQLIPIMKSRITGE